MVSVGCQGQAPLCLDQMMVEGRTESHSDLQHPSEQVRGVYGDSGPSSLIVNVATTPNTQKLNATNFAFICSNPAPHIMMLHALTINPTSTRLFLVGARQLLHLTSGG